METPVINCQNVRKTFRQRIVPISRLQDRILQRHQTSIMEICAVHDISLTVSKGEWLGIYGKNGSGKTTLLKMIAGLLVPDSGTVSVNGILSIFFDLGIGFHPERTARENIRIHGLLQGMDQRTIEKTMNDIIAFADIGDHVMLPMKCLSTGMAMRLAFASAAQVESDVYIFDEVLAVGDAEFKKKCLKHFKSLRARKKSVIIVSHDAEQLYQLTDRGLTLEEGKIKEEWKGGYNETTDE